MIQLKNVTVGFHGKTILNNLSCTINRGDFITIVGPNGAGKTVLLDTIAGKIKPLSGNILLDDQDITDMNEQKRTAFISRMFQNPQLNCVTTMTVAQNLALASLRGRKAQLSIAMNSFPKVVVDTTLKQLNLAHRLEVPMSKLSGGQRQTIAFIMATLVPPQLLLLDEPTAALDPGSATELLCFAARYLKEHAITTLLITHDPYLAINLGNKLWILEKGTIVKEFSDEKEKLSLSPQDLIGHLDYERIKAINQNS